MKTFIKNIIAFVVTSSIVLSCAQSSQTVNSDRDSVNQEDKNVNTANISQSESESEFVLAAADGGMLEVRLAERALDKALSQEVKSFAQSMVTDHGKANEELKTLAAKSNISIPTTLSTTSQQKYDDISEKDGEHFDRAYAEAMISDHKETIEKFYVLTNIGRNSEISDWAKGKIPMLEHHLMMAEKMYETVKKAE